MIAGKSVMQIMQRPGLSDFVQIINVAGLAQTFDNFNTLTVFAPTNEAIRRKFLCYDTIYQHIYHIIYQYSSLPPSLQTI